MRCSRGWTLVETVVVVALLGLAVAIGSTVFVGAGAHAEAAATLARQIATARWHALVTGTAAPCLPDGLQGAPPRDVRVAWPTRGLSFTADGLPRTCDGGGVGNATILVEHRGRQAAVVVSTLGRVRWELR